MRRFSLVMGGLAVGLAAATFACSSASDAGSSATSDIVNIPVTPVINQGENNTCWMYATNAWLESLHIAATGSSPHYSPAYLEYWYFFSQLETMQLSTSQQVYQTGYWGWAGDYILARGLVPLGDFDVSDKVTELDAFNYVNTKLADGSLGPAGSTLNGTQVRAVLDEAFGLTAAQSALLTQVFGEDGSRWFGNGAVAAHPIVDPTTFAVATPVAGKGTVRTTLDQVVGTWRSGPTTTADDRDGALAWTGAYPPDYPGFQSFMGADDVTQPVELNDAGQAVLPPLPKEDPATWRPFLQRIQRALNDGAPMPILWEEVLSDADTTGTFRQGPSALDLTTSHVTLVTDYQVSNVPGYGTLYAGTQATPAELVASLDDGALVDFFRVKNSYGLNAYPAAAVPGDVDLELSYLMQPVYACDPSRGNLSDPTASFCTAFGPMLWDIILPPGY